MEKDELIKKRLIELSNMADKKGIVTFSDFLDMNGQNLFSQIKNDLYTKYNIYGGYEQAERQIVAFIPDALYYAWNYPINYIEIEPLSEKFSEKLNHRDVLGALMNLGIERSKLGDIIMDEKKAYVICLDNMSDFICESLYKIRHTTVKATVKPIDSFSYEPKLVPKEGVIASNRLDCIVAFAFGIGRSDAVNLIQAAKVFVNAKLVTSNAYFCKPNDVISVRGHGKLQYEDILNETKKGRARVRIYIYS